MNPTKPRNLPKAPKGLPAAAAKFWRDVMGEFRIEEGQHIALLTRACVMLGRAIQAGEIVQRDGVTTVNSRGEVKEHPSVATERSCSLAFQRLTRELGLDVAPVSELRGHARPGARR